MKPRVGIFGLTGCAGDQLQILNCEGNVLYGMGVGVGAQSPTASYLITILPPLALPG